MLDRLFMAGPFLVLHELDGATVPLNQLLIGDCGPKESLDRRTGIVKQNTSGGTLYRSAVAVMVCRADRTKVSPRGSVLCHVI
jgi:hypothetical protein